MKRRHHSGDDVRSERVVDLADPVAQGKLAFLQPRKLQLVVDGGTLQGFDRRIEVAMLLPQTGQFVLELLPVGTIGALCHPSPTFSRTLPEAKSPKPRARRLEPSERAAPARAFHARRRL